jgi:hypothetical protein
VLALCFEKQHHLQRKIEFLIVFVKSDSLIGLSLIEDKLMNFLDGAVHPSAADRYLILRELPVNFNAYFHRITSSCLHYIVTSRQFNTFLPTGDILPPRGK